MVDVLQGRLPTSSGGHHRNATATGSPERGRVPRPSSVVGGGSDSCSDHGYAVLQTAEASGTLPVVPNSICHATGFAGWNVGPRHGSGACRRCCRGLVLKSAATSDRCHHGVRQRRSDLSTFV